MAELDHFSHSKRINNSTASLCAHRTRRHVFRDDSNCMPRTNQNVCLGNFTLHGIMEF